MSWLFKLRGELDTRQSTILGIIGLLIFFLIWVMLTAGASPMVNSGILPSPFKVLSSYGDLCSENNLIKNTFFSIGLNLAGYIKAIILSLIFGFLIGLYPIFRGMFKTHVEAIRFVPIAAAIGLFIVWFGSQTSMKVNFLAFGIIIFMLPVVVHRIDEVRSVYLKTVHTLGATDWQVIRTVYIPSVFSRLFDDIRILTAISWTYIVFAEMVASQGGIGYLTFAVRRFGRTDKLFALLLLIIFIGLIQDRVFKYLDKEFFPHKYQTKSKYSDELEEPSYLDVIFDFMFKIFVWILLAAYLLMAIAEYFPIFGDIQPPLSYLFQDTIWAIHLIFLMIVGYKLNKLYKGYSHKQVQTKVANAGV